MNTMISKDITVAQLLEHQVLLPVISAGIEYSTIDLHMNLQYQPDEAIEFWDASPVIVRDSETGELVLKVVGNTRSSGTGERLTVYFNSEGEQVRCTEPDGDSQIESPIDDEEFPWVITMLRIECSEQIGALVDRILAHEDA